MSRKKHRSVHTSKATPSQQGGGEIFLPQDIGDRQPEGSSILKEQRGSMEWQRRLDEQQGHRYHLQVQVKETKEIKDDEHAAPEGGLQNGINQHPWLDKQIFDGADPDVNPAPPLNTDARREYDNQQREQELEKQLRLENQLQNTHQPSSAPRPKGP